MRQEYTRPHQRFYKNDGIWCRRESRRKSLSHIPQNLLLHSTFTFIFLFFCFIFTLIFRRRLRFYWCRGIPCLTQSLIIPQVLPTQENKKSPLVCSRVLLFICFSSHAAYLSSYVHTVLRSEKSIQRHNYKEYKKSE